MKTLLTRLLCPIAASFGLIAAQAATPTLTLSHSTIQNDAIANIVYTIGGVASGETVMVERFLDVNANGAIDAGEPLTRRFSLTDGQAPSIGGVRNKNIVGDDDGAQNGAIRADIPFPGIDPGLERIDGRFLIRVTAAGGTAMAALQVAQPNLPQRIVGTVMNAANSAPIPFAFVIVVPPDAPGIFTTTFANASGAFSVAVPEGNWALFGSAGGFIAPGDSAEVSVPAGQTVTHNVPMIAGATRITGRVVDSVTGAGIPSLIISAQTDENAGPFQIAVDLTDANGNFRLSVNAGQWEVEPLDQSLQRAGYLPNSAFVTVAGAEVAQNLPLTRANAMIYGRLTRSTGEPLPGLAMWVQMAGQDEDDMPSASINANGEYFIAVGPGMWELGPESSALAPLRLRPYGQNATLAADQAVQRNFAFEPTTAVVAGWVRDQNGTPIVGVNFHGHFGDNGESVGNGNTGTEGQFEIPVWGGQWRFHVGDDLEGSGLIESQLFLTVADGVDQRNIVYVVLRTNRQITGSVRTSGDQPVSNVGIYAMATIDGKDYEAFGNTDGSGNYSLGVVDGSWEIYADCWDLQQQNYSCPNSLTRVVSGGNQTANFTVNPPQVDAHLRGRAVDQSGNPISGLNIGAYGNGPQRQATTNPNGEFDIGVSAGWWTLQINGNPPPGTISPSISYQVQQGIDINNINFRVLTATFAISGAVRNSSGVGEAGLFVFTGSTVDGISYYAQSETDGNGAYSLPVVNGDWQMWMDCSGVESRGYDCPQLEGVTVSGANVTREITLTMPDARLIGRIVDERGQGLQFMMMMATSGDRTTYFNSGNNGEFRIGVSAGPVELKVSNGGNYIVPTMTFNVTRGVDIENITYRVLDIDRNIVGTLRNTSGQGLQGVFVYATAVIDGQTFEGRDAFFTDPSGFFSIAAAYGTWRLHFDCADLEMRGYVCPVDVTYELTPTSGNINVIVQTAGAEGASLSNLQYTGGANPIFRFRVTGSPGTYDIVRSDTLLNGSWSNTGTSVTISPGGTFQDVILPVSGSRGFYGAMRR